MPQTTDSGTGVPPSTVVAAEPDYRFTLANERTFLAWQRTSLGLLAAGLAAFHFLPEAGHQALGYSLGAWLGTLATITAAGGLHRWRRNDTAIRRGSPLPAAHLPLILTATLASGGVAAAVLVLYTVATR